MHVNYINLVEQLNQKIQHTELPKKYQYQRKSKWETARVQLNYGKNKLRKRLTNDGEWGENSYLLCRRRNLDSC